MNLIEEAFESWRNGDGNRFFELLADDAVWEIVGDRRPAGTYHGRKAYVAAAVTPLMERLAEPVRPEDVIVLVSGDDVAVRWRQDTPLLTGGRYQNRYAWFLTMQAGRISRVIAFLDLEAYRNAVGEIAGPVIETSFDFTNEAAERAS